MNEVADLMERQINECRKKNVSVDVSFSGYNTVRKIVDIR